MTYAICLMYMVRTGEDEFEMDIDSTLEEGFETRQQAQEQLAKWEQMHGRSYVKIFGTGSL